MSGSFKLLSSTGSDAKELKLQGTAGLDFMTVSYRDGHLTVGGNLMQSSTWPGRLKNIQIDATLGPGMIWFQGIDVSALVTTADHGTLLVKPTTGLTMLPLISAPGVLPLLGLASGLVLKSIYNTEAILGLLSGLIVDKGVLCSTANKPLSPQDCLGMLGQLGVETSATISIRECVELCGQLGLLSEKATGLFARALEHVRGHADRLDRYIGLLEIRGYRLRLNGRLSSVCHPIPDPAPIPHTLFQRPFIVPGIVDEFVIAA